MRLIKRNINSDGSGSVTLYPEEPEDMWHALNLIRPRDLLKASAMRRVTDENGATGAVSSRRVHTNLTILVKSLDFDPQAGQLHVSGTVAVENNFVKIGQHHTLDLDLNRNFSLEKVVDGEGGGEGWDSVARAQLEDAVDPTRGTDAVAVVMQEGLANICFITAHQTVLRQRIEQSVPRKRIGSGRSAEHDKGLTRFYKTALENLTRQLETLFEGKDETVTFPVLLASPGFTANGFLRYIRESVAAGGSSIIKRLLRTNSFVEIHSSSGHLHSLNEVLRSPEVKVRLKDTKYAKETELMDHFFTLLRKDDGRAWYGPREVERAVDEGAVGRGGGVLFISNDLFRSQDVAVRRRWVTLVDRVRDVEGGEVRVLSGDHESGKRLEGLGGIAAILTFPIPDIDDEGDEDENENQEEHN